MCAREGQKLEILGLCKRFGALSVLDDFSLALPQSGFVCLFGPSGCGKTTLLNIMAGLLQPDAGQMIGLKGLKSAFVFQEDRLLPWLSALENVAVVREKDKNAEAQAWLCRVGLGDALHQRPDTLSGGQRQRVAVARAMHYGGDILFLDEPFKGLDEAMKGAVMDLVAAQWSDRLVIMITHDREEALRLSDEIVLLEGPPLRVRGRITIPLARDVRQHNPALLAPYHAAMDERMHRG